MEKIAFDFEQKWNSPTAIGAFHGKHIAIFASAGSGSAFFNYYKFTLVDIGYSGRQGDVSMYANSNLGHAIENNSLNIPIASRIDTKILPYVFLDDNALDQSPYDYCPFDYTDDNSPIGMRLDT